MWLASASYHASRCDARGGGAEAPEAEAPEAEEAEAEAAAEGLTAAATAEE